MSLFNKVGSKAWFNYTLLAVGIICISWSAILVKIAGVSGFGSGFYRLLFGTLVIVPFWLYYRKPVHDWQGVKIAITCGILFACDIALWNSSILLSKASISTLLANLAPVWVGLCMLLFLRERPGKLFWPGTLVAMAGVALVIGIEELLNFEFSTGNNLAIAASVFYGAYLLTVRRGRNTLDTLSFTTISMLASTVVLGLISVVTATPLWGFSATSWWALVALGVVPQVVGWITINHSLGHINPTVASVSLLSQTVFTAVFSVPVLGELLTPTELIGGVVILGGVFLVNFKPTRLRE